MQLEDRQQAALNEAILSLYAPYDLSVLPDRFLQAMRMVIAGDLTHISLTKPGIGAVDAFLDQPAHEALVALADHRDDLLDMPGFKDGAFYLKANTGPVSYHDFMSRDRLAQTALWEFLCRPLDLKWDLSVNFHSTSDLFFTISTSRSGRNQHSDAERVMLALLQPHLRQRFQLAVAAEPDHPLLQADPARAPASAHHLICDEGGRIVVVGEATLDALRRAGFRHGHQIPADWLAWMRTGRGQGAIGRAPVPFRQSLPNGARIVLHDLSDRSSGQYHLILQFEGGAPVALSRREEEVARWLVAGKTNGEIATILGISAATVKHHVASILDKLMVENRTTAAIRLERMFKAGR